MEDESARPRTITLRLAADGVLVHREDYGDSASRITPDAGGLYHRAMLVIVVDHSPPHPEAALDPACPPRGDLYFALPTGCPNVHETKCVRRAVGVPS